MTIWKKCIKYQNFVAIENIEKKYDNIYVLRYYKQIELLYKANTHWVVYSYINERSINQPQRAVTWQPSLTPSTQVINTGPQRFTFTGRFFTGDAKAAFNQCTLDIGICTIDTFNKVLLEITKYSFPAYAFCIQKRYLHRRLIKPTNMKLCSFIGRLQELNAYLAAFSPDIEDKKLHL